MPDWISHEPVAWVTFADAILLLLVSLGLPVEPNVKIAVDGIILAGSALFIRSQVTPQAKIAAVPLAARALKDAGQG